MTTKVPRVTLASLTPNNLGTVRKLNSVLFPIRYSEKFYQDILQPSVEDFCKLGAWLKWTINVKLRYPVYYNDIPVGTICCRMENKDDQIKLYLMTMGVLAPYRSRGLGSQSLELIVEAASAHKPKIDKIYLHVQISNDAAKKFYERHGFHEVDVHREYYKKIAPHDAWVLEKSFS